MQTSTVNLIHYTLRFFGTVVLLFASLQQANADTTPAGHWNSDRGELTLRPVANQFFSGNYTDNAGSIQAQLNDRVLTGEWRESNTSRRCSEERTHTYYWGTFRLEFIDDFRTFVGVWGYCGDTPSHPWTGDKFAEIADLPRNGAIQSRGMLPEARRGRRDPACTCRSVTLARLETKKYIPATGFLSGRDWRYETTSHYEIGQTPRSEISVPPLVENDMLCLYHTFPRDDAYFVSEGDMNHPCSARVTMRYPYARSRTGRIEETWDLFSIRGLADFRTAAGNAICRGLTNTDDGIPAGSGEILLSVNGVDCPTVRFTVGEQRDPVTACPARLPREFESLTCRCAALRTPNSVYGTFYYTADSDICAAAVHVGVIGREGGQITVQRRPARDYYLGSTLNNVTSREYGGYSGTLVFRGAVNEEQTLGKIPLCPSIFTGRKGDELLCRCLRAGTDVVWGSGPYTGDSSICPSARHAGVIPESGGVVRVHGLPGQKSYTGSQAHGVRSRDYDEYDRSIQVTPFQ